MYQKEVEEQPAAVRASAYEAEEAEAVAMVVVSAVAMAAGGEGGEGGAEEDPRSNPSSCGIRRSNGSLTRAKEPRARAKKTTTPTRTKRAASPG